MNGDATILRAQNFVQNWQACVELSSIDQMSPKWKKFCRFFGSTAAKIGNNYCCSLHKLVWCKIN